MGRKRNIQSNDTIMYGRRWRRQRRICIYAYKYSSFSDDEAVIAVALRKTSSSSLFCRSYPSDCCCRHCRRSFSGNCCFGFGLKKISSFWIFHCCCRCRRFRRYGRGGAEFLLLFWLADFCFFFDFPPFPFPSFLSSVPSVRPGREPLLLFWLADLFFGLPPFPFPSSLSSPLPSFWLGESERCRWFPSICLFPCPPPLLRLRSRPVRRILSRPFSRPSDCRGFFLPFLFPSVGHHLSFNNNITVAVIELIFIWQ